MKKAAAFLLALLLPLLFAACDFGDMHTDDPKQYSRKDGEITVGYFPETLDGYTVNSYSYTTYRYMDTCTEIFLDLTVSEEQLQSLLSQVKNYPRSHTEQKAYYDSNYNEIVFCDTYSVSEYSDNRNVGNAEITKVIYNEKTHNIIFEYFYAFDSGVYPLNKVAYFQRFHINEQEYIAHVSSYFESD